MHLNTKVSIKTLKMSNLIKESKCIRLETIQLKKIILILVLIAIFWGYCFKYIFSTTWIIYISHSGIGYFNPAAIVTTDYHCTDVRRDEFRVDPSTNEFDDVVYEFDMKKVDQDWFIWYHSGWSSLLSVDLDFTLPNLTYDKISTEPKGFHATINYKNNPTDVWKTFATLDPTNKVECHPALDLMDAHLWQCHLSVFKMNHPMTGEIYQLSVQLPRQARPASATFFDNPSTMTDIELTMVKEEKCIFELYYHPTLLPLLAIGAFMCLYLMTRRSRLCLLENTICFGGLLIMLNNDIEYLWTLINFPWIFFWMDLKKIISHGGFLLFMVIFIGEHIVDDEKPLRDRQFRDYQRSLNTVSITTCVLFLYHAWENEYRAWNPFSIIEGLTHPFPTPLIVVIALETMYLVYLTFAIGKVIMSVKKKRTLPDGTWTVTLGQKLSNKVVRNVIFVMIITWWCVATTILHYITMKLSNASKVYELNIIFEYPQKCFLLLCVMWVCYFGIISYLYSLEKISFWTSTERRFVCKTKTVNDEKKVIPVDDIPTLKTLI